MKETIQIAGNEVAIVIYDAPLPPKYFRLNKKFIRTFFVVGPVLLVLFLGGLFLWGLGTRLKETPRPSFPTIMNEQDSKIQGLATEVKQLKESNNQLTEKLASQQSSATGAEEPYLMSILRPYGMQNQLAQNKLNLDQFEITQEKNQLGLKFQIISTTPENRVTGHVLVFMISEAGVMIYPQEANEALSSGIKYNMGEPFAVSRLRPTNATFMQRPSTDNVKFIVYIFSREGDLLLIKETQNFKLGPKQ